MKAFLDRLHNRLGDFWWYSLMLFCAMRTADCLNVFVGLWLVPKYVEPSELGAVMPLTQFANFLAIPIAVFASTFRNELTSLAVNRRFGQMKTLMRSVFSATGIFLVLALVVCRFVLPAYLERIRIAEGSLGILLLLSAFVGAVSPIYSNALQALKKLKTNSLINLRGSPSTCSIPLFCSSSQATATSKPFCRPLGFASSQRTTSPRLRPCSGG